MSLAHKGQATAAFEAQSTLHAQFNSILPQSQGNLLIPALHTVSRTSKRLALAADAEGSSTEQHAQLHHAVTLLQESFSRTMNDRKELVPDAPYSEEGSKKVGVLYIVNTLFSIYFRLNTLRLCRNVSKPVERLRLHETGSRMGDRVTYKYYVGRLSLFEDQWEQAERELQYALGHCHRNAVRNKQAILRYLVPVQLFRGRFPNPECMLRCVFPILS